MELTKADLAALKHADRVVFSMQPGEDRGTASIRCIKEVKVKTKGFKASESVDVEHEFAVKAASIATKACFLVYRGGILQALSLILREGDKIVLRASDNGNGYTRAAMIPRGAIENGNYSHPEYRGLHQDCLWLSIYRNDKKSGGTRTIVNDMLVDQVVVPNNTARAISAS